jgi:hypothetical protein
MRFLNIYYRQLRKIPERDLSPATGASINACQQSAEVCEDVIPNFSLIGDDPGNRICIGYLSAGKWRLP